MTTQQELLKLQNTTDTQNTDNPKSSQLVEKEHYENTGFDIVGNEEYGYFVAIGIYRITEPQKTKEQCAQMIETKDYQLILGLIAASILADKTEQKNNPPVDR